MLSNIQRSIMIRAIRIRQKSGENPADILAGYSNLTEAERAGILSLATSAAGLPICN